MPPDDNLIRDLPRIARYSRQNQSEDYQFRLHLKTVLPLSNVELDAIVQETTDDVWGRIDCLTCGNCCKTLQIQVEEKDMKRLAKRLQMSLRDFAARYIAVADDGFKHFNTAPCPFLEADNRCAVYEDRPQACRDFPYLRDRHFRSRTLSMIENTATCPIVFNVWEALKARFPVSAPNVSKRRRNHPLK